MQEVAGGRLGGPGGGVLMAGGDVGGKLFIVVEFEG